MDVYTAPEKQGQFLQELVDIKLNFNFRKFLIKDLASLLSNRSAAEVEFRDSQSEDIAK